MSKVPGRPDSSGPTPDRVGDPGELPRDEDLDDAGDDLGDDMGDDDEERRGFGAGLVSALKELVIVVVLTMTRSSLTRVSSIDPDGM